MGKNAHPLLKPILINGYCSREKTPLKRSDCEIMRSPFLTQAFISAILSRFSTYY